MRLATPTASLIQPWLPLLVSRPLIVCPFGKAKSACVIGQSCSFYWPQEMVHLARIAVLRE